MRLRYMIHHESTIIILPDDINIMTQDYAVMPGYLDVLPGLEFGLRHVWSYIDSNSCFEKLVGETP
jgi:hypothetical protein